MRGLTGAQAALRVFRASGRAPGSAELINRR
jgi:hypothetical protein